MLLTRRQTGSAQSSLDPDDGDGWAASPVALTFQALAVARVLGVAARVGIFGDLSDGPRRANELATRLGLERVPLQLMLDVLVGEGLLDHLYPNYSLTKDGRRWLDPESPSSVTTFLSQSLEYWQLWEGLDRIAVGRPNKPGPVVEDVQAWPRYIRANYEIDRLLADEVAAAIELPPTARSLLDLGGSHGGFAAAMCNRYPHLAATVIDGPGPVMVGRELMWEAEMDGAVCHSVGDIFTSDLGGRYDAALCQPLMTGLSAQKSALLLERLREALRPGAVLAILRLEESAQPPIAARLPSTAALELFLRLQTGQDARPSESIAGLLSAAGFSAAEVFELPSCPDVRLHVCHAL